MAVRTTKVRNVPSPVYPYPRGQAKLPQNELQAEVRRWGHTEKGKYTIEKVKEGDPVDGIDIDHEVTSTGDVSARDDADYYFDEGAPARFAAEKLKWLAAQLDLTQKEIAKRVGVSAVVINRIFKNPDRSSVATLRKIAKAMGVKLTELIHD
ncbi:MAG TPA: helix-turn-helix transcriptional regulator [Tepidisphaeraceae bacterium]|nr:helix-turn-helix transcriptional regulator [Tepidisphaeraceae bacterium]